MFYLLLYPFIKPKAWKIMLFLISLYIRKNSDDDYSFQISFHVNVDLHILHNALLVNEKGILFFL
ncbi:hypothetical protein CON82_29940 [Bacillus wiedmannii]|nr:hypothetical protein CON82_29940 [Bacillus wiedmannii]